MPSLKETKNRIASVAGTLKITSAMKMVAAAKLRKAQKALGNLLPYQQELHRILRDLIGAGELPAFADCLPPREGQRRLAIVAFASNSSLCGSFNANAIRRTLEVVREYRSEGWEVTVWSVGRKMADAMRREGLVSPDDYTELCAHPDYAGAAALGDALTEGFREGRFQRIELVYNHYRSAAAQPTVQERFLPLSLPAESEAKADGEAPEFIIEPDRESEILRLLPIVLRLKIYATLLDSVTAEHAARTVAMQMATDNAEDLLGSLTLEYNKRRQQKITAEILDLEGGALEA